MSRDELRSLQEQRFRDVLAFAWKVPFYRRHWGNAEVEPADIKGLDDIAKLPMYSKSDLMELVDNFPPMGDFHGMDAHPPGRRPPLVFHTTSGTTGKPQPLLFGPKSREVQNVLLARTYVLQGMRRRTSSIRSTDSGWSTAVTTSARPSCIGSVRSSSPPGPEPKPAPPNKSL